MKKRMIKFLLIMMIGCFGLCGCGSFPNLTANEQQLIAEYAAGILLQNSEASSNRLTDIEGVILEKEELIPEEPDVEPEHKEEPVVDEDNNQDEVPVIDNTVDNETEMLPSMPMNELLGLETLRIQSNGYYATKSYSEDGGFFALDASRGCQLVVINYSITNIGQETVEVDMMNTATSYKITLNGETYKSALSTMLLNDMTTYVGSIPAGETINVVLLSEWNEEEANNISNLGVRIYNNEQQGTYPVSTVEME